MLLIETLENNNNYLDYLKKKIRILCVDFEKVPPVVFPVMERRAYPACLKCTKIELAL